MVLDLSHVPPRQYYNPTCSMIPQVTSSSLLRKVVIGLHSDSSGRDICQATSHPCVTFCDRTPLCNPFQRMGDRFNRIWGNVVVCYFLFIHSHSNLYSPLPLQSSCHSATNPILFRHQLSFSVNVR